MQFFNTAGPVNKDIHYKLDPLHRWDLDEILMLIQQQKYFLLHAPRQTGKTSSLLALQKYLNAGDDFVAVYANFECGQASRNDKEEAVTALIRQLKLRSEDLLPSASLNQLEADSLSGESGMALNQFIQGLCKLSPKPLVLLIDEIDSLIGDTLISVLRQIRSGYDIRPDRFPQSIILCGVVDIKDYKINRSDGEIITGGSCFNIKSESLRLGNFSQAEIRRLYEQHTQATGQVFEEAVYDLVWDYTAGQPWLVNAIAYEACFEMKENRDRSVVITKDIFRTAKENLILSRATHLDQLADKLKEQRIRNVIEPMLRGLDIDNASNDDVQYAVDLGLVRFEDKRLIVSNSIYREVLPRELTNVVQRNFVSVFDPEWVNQDGSINATRLVAMFQQFWRENSEIWKPEIAGYLEAAPHLVFQGYLQRVANGQGMIEREYGLGRGRADLYLRWKSPAADQRLVFELKMRTEREDSQAKYEALLAAGLEQTAQYADKCRAQESHLIIFDRRDGIAWDDKIFRAVHDRNGRPITVWGM